MYFDVNVLPLNEEEPLGFAITKFIIRSIVIKYLRVSVPSVGRSKEVLVLNINETLGGSDQLDIRPADAVLDHTALLHLGFKPFF